MKTTSSSYTTIFCHVTDIFEARILNFSIIRRPKIFNRGSEGSKLHCVIEDLRRRIDGIDDEIVALMYTWQNS